MSTARNLDSSRPEISIGYRLPALPYRSIPAVLFESPGAATLLGSEPFARPPFPKASEEQVTVQSGCGFGV